MIVNRTAYYKLGVALVGLFWATEFDVFSQNNTSSLYSSFGIGEIQPLGIGALQGMGGVGIALKSSSFFNHTNPASNSGFATSVVKVETGVFYRHSQYKDKQSSFSTHDFNLSYFTLSFPTIRDFTFSVGLRPYSSVGYDVQLTSTVEGSVEQYQSNYSGEGGINQIFLGNAYRVNEHLSVGVNLSLLWGSIVRNEQLLFNNISSRQSINEEDYTLWGGKVDYGIQYTFRINETWRMRLGGLFEQPIKFSGTYTERIYSSLDNQITFESQPETFSDLSFPYAVGVGIALEHGPSWVIGVDGYYQHWTQARLWEHAGALKNSTRLTAGVEYTPKIDPIKRKNRTSYRMGMHLTDSYLLIEDNPIPSYGLSVGVGIPFRFTGSMNIGYQYESKGTTNNSLIIENNHQVSVSFTLPDIWFIKKAID